MRRVLLVVAMGFVLGPATGCSPAPDVAPPVTPGTFEHEPLGAAPVADVPMTPIRYVDVTSEAGIDFVAETGGYGEKLLPETMGSGCAFLDHDGDGDEDLLFLNGDWWPGHEKEGQRPTARLYRNDGGFRFTDITADSGLTEPFYGMGVSACDTDGDGDTDVFVCGAGGYRFYRNDGGRFTDVTPASGLDPGTWTDAEGGVHPSFATSAAFLDYDLDGLPDLFVCHYVNWSKETDVFSTMDGKNKSFATPRVYSGESSRLWRNVGGNRFEDVTETAGVLNDRGKSLCAAILDFNGDGFPDIAVANDTQPDYLYRNNGDGTFTDRGLQAGIAVNQTTGRALAGMGIDACVLPDTGKPALAVGNFSGEPLSFFEHLRGELFINRADVAGVALVTHHTLTFGVRFVDADLDGTMDILLANGHIEPTIQSVHKDIPYEQPMQFLRGLPPQKGFVKFREETTAVGDDFVGPRVARALACADVDLDGDLDLCVTVNGGAPVLLRCDLDDAASRSLRVRVRGAAPATDALGAEVVVKQGARTQLQWVRTGSGYLSQSEMTLTFGLGDRGPADSVTVTWPDGTTKTVEDVGPGVIEVSP